MIHSIEAEYRRYKALGEGALSQLQDEELSRPGPGGGNSAATLVWHIASNLKSRFTDFLTSDGEKPWRRREEEFARRSPSRSELMGRWEEGWGVLFETLAGLTDGHLDKTVRIRGRELTVAEALHRSLAHTASHVGQILYLAKGLCGERWEYLSIPPGASDRYNENPAWEKPAELAARIKSRDKTRS